MSITAQDIENQSFSISKRGYDVDEVDVFLERVAEEIDSMNKLIESLRSGGSVEAAPAEKKDDDDALDSEAAGEVSGEKDNADIIAEKDRIIEDLREKLADKNENDNAISQALIVAQRSADEIIANANSKADITIADAHDEADRIVSRAEAEKQNIMDAISKLEEDKEGTRSGYAELLLDFIEDANAKLGTLGIEDDSKKSYASTSGGSYGSNEAFDIDSLVASSSKPSVKQTVNSSVVDKDLSGFGEVADDTDDID